MSFTLVRKFSVVKSGAHDSSSQRAIVAVSQLTAHVCADFTHALVRKSSFRKAQGLRETGSCWLSYRHNRPSAQPRALVCTRRKVVHETGSWWENKPERRKLSRLGPFSFGDGLSIANDIMHLKRLIICHINGNAYNIILCVTGAYLIRC